CARSGNSMFDFW
nr:immunoglobulin heavy chain junction region [Macaca mulatta]